MASKKHPLRFAAEPETVAKFRNLCYAKGLSANRVIEAFMERALAAEHDEVTLTGLIGQPEKRVRNRTAEAPT
jgi:hypothetical protein